MLLIGEQQRLNCAVLRGFCDYRRDGSTLPVGDAGCRHVVPRQDCVMHCLCCCIEAVRGLRMSAEAAGLCVDDLPCARRITAY
jgi:hypothetical protein